ncbi:MAG TPA: stage II sporulation protein M [Methanomethylovorans sp.]|nr:stage II sporulation protein M [Methanomethylovorans sp.]
MNNKEENDFHIVWHEIRWSSKIFILAMFIAWMTSMLFYFLSLATASPEPVNDAITSTAAMAMKKVNSAAEHLDLMWSIFLFNSLAVITASVGNGLLPFIQNISIAELKVRAHHQKYTTFSVKVEQLFQLASTLIKDSTQRLDPGIARLRDQDNSETEDSIWKRAKYSKEHFRLLAYVIPYLIPVITLTLNGMLLGIIFNGTLSSYNLIGPPGIGQGILFSVSYFLAFILPHGIIELPVIIMAGALGYRFARVYSDKIVEDKLLSGNEAESLEKDISYLNSIATEYIRSSYLRTMVSGMLILLLVAAYIETNITPNVARQVADLISRLLF